MRRATPEDLADIAETHAEYRRKILEVGVHAYLSTACLHGEHAQCRKSCKFCGQQCYCECHR